MRDQKPSTARDLAGEGARLVFPLVLLLGMVTLVLSLLNLVPSYLQEGGLRSYATIRDAERDLGIEIPVPAYYPDYLSWPPADISGQRTPYPAVDVKVRSRGDGAEVLWIHEELTDKESVYPDLKSPTVVVEKTPVSIGEASGWHVVLKDMTGTYYHQVYWRDGTALISVTTIYAWQDLQRMANSMSPQH